ncbi:MAG: hypothetical protein Q4A23_01115 [bacterium]|nr:hypothetical protein [bacterium]
MKKLSNYLISGLVISSIVAVMAQAPVLAANIFDGGLHSGLQQGKTSEMPTTIFGNTGIFTRIVSVMLFAVGILSIIMLIFGGLRYIISNGDSKKVEAAKNTILYAIIGLIVAIMSYAIVNFVVSSFTTSGGGINSTGSSGANGVAPTDI